MAENESLDLGKSRRWQRVSRAIANGDSPVQIASLAAVSLRQTVNAIRKPAIPDGPPQIPLGELLDVLQSDPNRIDQIIRRCEGHDYARLFKYATIDSATREDAVESYLCSICDKFLDQIAVRSVRADGENTCNQINSKLSQVRDCLKPEIARIAHHLSDAPERVLRRPPSSAKTNGDTQCTKSILNESLLGLSDE